MSKYCTSFNFENVEGTIQFYLIEPKYAVILILNSIKVEIWNKSLRYVNKNPH